MTNLSVEPIAMTSGVPAKPQFFTLSLLPRLVGFSVLFFIVWLLFSTLFMPLMSSTATRAILNAPVILLTTPIDGVVSSLTIKPGEGFEKGQTIATIENPRANQETLLTLQTRRLTLEQQLASLKGQAEHDQQFYDALEKTSQQYQKAYRTRQQFTQRALRAESAAADARLQDAQSTVARNLELFRQGAVSEATVASSKAQLASLQGAAESVRSQLRINSGDASAASEQVYLDPDQLRLYDLQTQMTTLQLSLANQAKHQATQQEELDNLNRLIETEQNRVSLMAAYNVIAYAPGTVQELVAPEGTLVRAGSTLVRATHCNQSNVIAVFPERMASKITRDTVLTVDVAGLNQPLRAHVTQLLSKPSDTLSSNYSVPFPFAEQNSVYVVGAFDDDLSENERARTCNPGNWVTVEVSR
ncbi:MULTISPECIES: HlyD family secretion protein [unclassified Pseudomonas]|uniref:HlyD family secretion protein n=1 Tax=unclassified Pseudomonas TaxID=196821 RepID=UPI00384DFCB3